MMIRSGKQLKPKRPKAPCVSSSTGRGRLELARYICTEAPPGPQELVDRLARLPGFRNILIKEYVSLDYEQVVGAIRDPGPIAEFARLAAALEPQEQQPG